MSNRIEFLAKTTPAFTAITASPNDVGRNSTKTTNPPTQRMADVVEAAMAAAARQRDGELSKHFFITRQFCFSFAESNTREHTSTREPPSSIKQSATPPAPRQPLRNSARETSTALQQIPLSTSSPRDPPSATKQITTPPISRQPLENPPREPAPPIQRTATPPTSRQPPENPPRESAPPTRPIATPPSSRGPSQNQQPPPYSPASTNTPTSSRQVVNREDSNAGSYNVRNAEGNLSGASAVRTDGFRDVRLHRVPDFQGFGFHLQYNQSYYLVQRVEVGSPAERAGLRAQDVILSINQQTTANMSHSAFVEIVNASSTVDFRVQAFDDYIRDHPKPVRNQQAASQVAASMNNDSDRRKNGLSKALGKLGSR